ncbi:MAG: CRISPR-associated endonuclease Cas2 [Epsilonproteobacteria bacterium]|jgi:CRISPR-associated protein Cas2|nr:CRISPR-associated endonuclease Cas2 [Campylobacterota bacterium]
MREKFLVAYDIRDLKRLRRVAKLLEKNGVRIEYSVFYMESTKDEMSEFAINLSVLIDPDEDDVRIYIIEDEGFALGNAQLIEEIFILK